MADNNDTVTALENFIQSVVVDFVNTAMECEVVSYEGGRVSVRPVNKKSYDDGDTNDYAVLHNLRVQWPQFAGGKAGVKGPIVAGDRCLLIVCQHPMDDSGDNRKYSIIDSYVIPGAGYSDAVPGNDDMRLYFGNAFVSITSDGKVNINAPGGFNVTSPQSTFSEKVNVNGLFTYAAGATGSGGTGGVMTLTGNVVINGEATINGVKVSTHKHTGDSGGTTSAPLKG